MAADLFKEIQIEKKWVTVKDHYERVYKIKFKDRSQISDEKIEELHKSLVRLRDSELNHKRTYENKS